MRLSSDRVTTDTDNAKNDVTLTWSTLTVDDNRINGGSDITGYDVEYRTSDDDEWQNVSTGPTIAAGTGTFNHDDLDTGTTYQYRIAAVNAIELDTTNDDDGGRGPWSSTVTADIDPILPGAPRLGNDDLTPNVNSITIDWDVPLDDNQDDQSATNPINDGGADIASYEIWVGTETETDPDVIAALTATIAGLPATRTEYEHLGLKSATPFFYRVRARNRVGVGPWSAEATISTRTSSPGTPGAPATPTTTIDGGTVTVDWGEPTNRGALPITGYLVQYVRDDDPATTGEAAINTLFSGATTVTISTPTTTEWDHEDAEGGAGVAWAYRVAAVNGNGNGDWSAHVRTPVRCSGPVRASLDRDSHQRHRNPA